MQLDFAKMDGLLPAVVQDAATREVLMVGFVNEAAWEKTRRTGHVTFWSRTRHALWTKGETSRHYLVVRRVRTDCDHDTLLIEAEPLGPTCHTGAYSCFFNEIENEIELEEIGAGETGLDEVELPRPAAGEQSMVSLASVPSGGAAASEEARGD